MRRRRPIPPKATFDGPPFERFAKTMRALIGVPKRELADLLKKEQPAKHDARRTRP